MNPHIELVKKYLADPESVSLEELKANRDDAWVAVAIADAIARRAASAASTDEDECLRKIAIEAVEEYEELTKEQGE